jgi:hypothetical protein
MECNVLRNRCFPLAVLACLLIGCSGDPLGRQSVSGTVRLDGQPLDHGSIRFEPQNAAVRVAGGAVIIDGAFSLAKEQGLPPGRYAVSISSPDIDPDFRPRADEKMEVPDLVPPRYNSQSELAVEVKQGASNHFEFDLQSQP